MGKAFNFLSILLTLISLSAKADFLDVKANKTPKWSRLSLSYGRATSEALESSSNFNGASFKNIRGNFVYGLEYSFIYQKKDQIKSTSMSLGFRPDWNLEVEPSLDVIFGLSDRKKEMASEGTNISLQLSLDFFKGPFYSTTISYRRGFYEFDQQSKSLSIQSVLFGVNVDFY